MRKHAPGWVCNSAVRKGNGAGSRKAPEGSVIQQNEKSAERREADAKLDADRLKEERAKAAENAELYRKATPGAASAYRTGSRTGLGLQDRGEGIGSDKGADSDADYKGRMSR